MNHDPKEILRQYWGYSNFRPLQEEVIHYVISGKDALALMPTGGGKSLCYQVPALCIEGLCLVISPLIALMKDQVESLRRKNISAFAVYAGMSRKEVSHTLQVAANSNCKFLYVSPERLETNLFKEWLPGLGISLIAVDEAHCISQWGYDFRPPYLRIAALRTELPGVPVLALTASATPDVQEDICEKLLLQSPGKFRQSFARPNLSYSVFETDSKINKISEVLRKVPGSSLIYCKSRKRTKEISDLLRLQGVASDYYHAGLSTEERNRRQEGWLKNNIRCMVCTNAFGMGIDKPDVRVVIHADVPESLEHYYQEAGRAGRDGKKAYAVLLYNQKELDELKQLKESRFPAIESIREVYQQIMNYIQLPVHSGEGQYFDFDISDFLKKFKTDPFLLMAVLRTLEQEDHWSFTENFFTPSTVQFIADRQWLHDFENSQPSLEPLIKILLRNYEGIFDYPARVSEKWLAHLLRTGQPEIIQALMQLHAYRIIQYMPQKDKPQLFFPSNRAAAEYLTIDREKYHRRQEAFARRTDALSGYVLMQSNCRSSSIANYFGDEAVQACGICDNCLNEKRKTITPDMFEKIEGRITGLLKQQNCTSAELMLQLEGFHKETTWQVLQFMQAENRIEVDKDGFILLK